MSESGDTAEKESRARARGGRIARAGCMLLLFIFFAMMAIATPWADALVQGTLLTAFGWIRFFERVLPELEWNPSMIASSLIALTAAIVGFHAIARRLRKGWRFRWTLAFTGLGSVLFAAAIAVTGIFHQGVWFFKSENLTYDRSTSRLTNNINNVRQLVILMRTFESEKDLPDSIYEMETFREYYDIDPGEEIDFLSFVDKHGTPHEWLYFPEAITLSAEDSSTTAAKTNADQRMVLASPVDIEGKYIVAFFGGNVRAVKKGQYLELLASRHAALLRTIDSPAGKGTGLPNTE